MAKSGEESTDCAKIDARSAQKPKITQVVMDKRKFFNPFLNVSFPQVKLGFPVKLGISVGTVSFLAGFACGYITAVSQQDLIKTVDQRAVEDSQVIKTVDQRAVIDSQVIKSEVYKVLEEYKMEFMKSVMENMLEEKATEQNKIAKK